MKLIIIFLVTYYNVIFAQTLPVNEMRESEFTFKNIDLSLEERVSSLINELTLNEKIGLMEHNSKSVERLDIPEYNWWNEGLHGVARSAPATVFPQAIGMAATFNPVLIEKIATAISDEGRALYHAAIKQGIHRQYLGLTYWSPNVNIFRDPRWGRGHETYGEDPLLSSVIGAAFVNGLQGKDEKYLKIAACAKHFAVHNGPEAKRHTFNALSNKKDLIETYLPAFKHLIEQDVAGVMCAYNRTNDEACCGSPTLLLDILRNEWRFDGYVVSDCGALNDLHKNHKVTANREESAAMAIKSDVNVNCGSVYRYLNSAIDKGLIEEKELDAVLAKQLKIRFRLGMFDPIDKVPYSSIPLSVVNSDKHKKLSRKVARESIVLLKNEKNVLPLKKDFTQIYVCGNNAADVNALMGNYYGVAKNYVTVLEGIANAVSPTTIVQFNQTILLEQDLEETKTNQVWNAQGADATIAVIGISPLYEGENGDTPFSKTGGDRKKIELPPNQLKFLKDQKKACGDKPLIVVILSGSAIAIPEVHELADAILWAWYPGEQGGNAVADVLFGDYSPSGKLPITIYSSTNQLGDFEDYSISEGGWTYRYFKGEPLYPFGYGLSYNNLSYELIGNSNLQFNNNEVEVKVKIVNNGTSLQNEVVQLYVSKPNAGFLTPISALKEFKNISLNPGEISVAKFTISRNQLLQINDLGEEVLPKGEYKVHIGSSSPSSRLKELTEKPPIELSIMVK